MEVVSPPARRKRRLVAAALALAAAGWAAVEYQTPYHAGPAGDHFDGVRFFNPEFPIGKGLWDVVLWRLRAETAEWPESVPLTATTRPKPRVPGTALQVTWVGHATVLIQTAGLNILTDPIWSERAFGVPWAGPRRVTPPGIAFEDLPPIDVVLVTHSHFDHMDLPTLARLQDAHAPLFVVPLGNDAILRHEAPAMNLKALDWWESDLVSPDVRVHVVPVYHWSRRGSLDRNKALWGGFVIEAPGGNLFFTGDTGLGSGAFFRQAAERFGGFRLAFLPIGAYEPRWFMQPHHMNPAEAVQAHQLLQARASMAIHFRTFQLSDEGIDQPAADLAAALRERKVPTERFFTLPIGGVRAEPGPN